MKEVARFFWERQKRAWQMDGWSHADKYWIEAQEWTDAYRNTLSKSKQQQFDKEFIRLDKELEDFHNASPKKQKNLNPMNI